MRSPVYHEPPPAVTRRALDDPPRAVYGPLTAPLARTMHVTVCQYDGATTLRALPLAAGLLVASARRDPALAGACTLVIRAHRDALAAEARALAAADVVALSLYAWNERFALACAARAKALSPGLVVIVGGPSVPRRPADADAFVRAHPAVDLLVFGEGEVTFPAILRALLAGRPAVAVPGVAARAPSGGLAVAPPRPRLVADPARYRDPSAHPHRFADTASPYLDGTFDALLADGFAPQAAIFETNRGCPFACSFCDWGQATASAVHELPLDRVEAELRWAAHRAIPYVYLVDANFGIRRRDLGIIEHLGRLRAETGHPSYCYFHLTKNATRANLATVLALRDAHIGTQVALSVQDFDPAVLAAVRRANIAPASALELRRELHARGLPTTNELLLGLPEQTLAGFRATVTQALTPFPGDSFYLYPVQLLVNAPLADASERARFALETRLVPVDEPPGAPPLPVDAREREELIVGTRTLPPADWRLAYAFGYLASALHNQRHLAVTLRLLGFVLGLDRAAWLDHLLAAARAAPPDAALAAVARELLRRADAVLASASPRLPVAGAGPRPRDPTEAVTACVLADPDRFYAEVAAATRAWLADRDRLDAWPQLADLLAYERFVQPTWRAPASTATFAWDWRAYALASGETPPAPRRHTLARAASPWAPAPTFGDHLDHALALNWAKAEHTGFTELSPTQPAAREPT